MAKRPIKHPRDIPPHQNKYADSLDQVVGDEIISDQGYPYQALGRYWVADFQDHRFKFASNQVGSPKLSIAQRNGFGIREMNYFMSHGVLELIAPHIDLLNGAASHLLVPVNDNQQGYIDIRMHNSGRHTLNVINIRWPDKIKGANYQGWVTDDISQIEYPHELKQQHL